MKRPKLRDSYIKAPKTISKANRAEFIIVRDTLLRALGAIEVKTNTIKT